MLQLTLVELHKSSSPIQTCFQVCCLVSIIVFITSSVTKNYSQVDKVWSIIPAIYTYILIFDHRSFIMSTLVTVWSVRLTYNFYRRGGYHWPPWLGDEDYRWKYLQDGYLLQILRNDTVWTIFNLVFISIYQNVLLLLIVSPSMIVYVYAHQFSDHYNPSLNVLDIIAITLFLVFVLIETIADNQQYIFQKEKYRRRGEQHSNNNKTTSSTGRSI